MMFFRTRTHHESDGVIRKIGCAADRAFWAGSTFEQFQKDLAPILRKNGWWHTLDSKRWLPIIFNNMRVYYAVRQWDLIQRTKKTRPYLRYIAIIDDSSQEKCQALNNIIRHADDPFWDKFYPCGDCSCTVQQLNEKDMNKWQLSVTKDENLPNFVTDQLR